MYIECRWQVKILKCEVLSDSCFMPLFKNSKVSKNIKIFQKTFKRIKDVFFLNGCSLLLFFYACVFAGSLWFFRRTFLISKNETSLYLIDPADNRLIYVCALSENGNILGKHAVFIFSMTAR